MNPDVQLAAAADALEERMRDEVLGNNDNERAATPNNIDIVLREENTSNNAVEILEDYEEQRPAVADDNRADTILDEEITNNVPRAIREPEDSRVINYDETTAYYNMRYVGSVEAAWRTLGLAMHYKSHTVVQLAIHDEGDASVTFRRGQENNALTRKKYSTLEAFMLLNAGEHRALASQYTYLQCPEYFTRLR
jgi:hypothetical protein